MAVAIGDEIVGCDLFDKPSTCRKVWNRLLSGLVFGALQAKESERQAETLDIEDMIRTTSSAPWEPAEPIGEGEEYLADFDGGDYASALTFEDSLVHGSVLAKV